MNSLLRNLWRQKLNLRSIYSTHKSISFNSTKPEKSKTELPNDGLKLKDFLVVGKDLPKINETVHEDVLPPYLQNLDVNGHNRKILFEVFGCQMNVNDTGKVFSYIYKKFV